MKIKNVANIEWYFPMNVHKILCSRMDDNNENINDGIRNVKLVGSTNNPNIKPIKFPNGGWFWT